MNTKKYLLISALCFLPIMSFSNEKQENLNINSYIVEVKNNNTDFNFATSDMVPTGETGKNIGKVVGTVVGQIGGEIIGQQIGGSLGGRTGGAVGGLAGGFAGEKIGDKVEDHIVKPIVDKFKNKGK